MPRAWPTSRRTRVSTEPRLASSHPKSVHQFPGWTAAPPSLERWGGPTGPLLAWGARRASISGSSRRGLAVLRSRDGTRSDRRARPADRRVPQPEGCAARARARSVHRRGARQLARPARAIALPPRSILLSDRAWGTLEPELAERAPGCPIYLAAQPVLDGIVGSRSIAGCLPRVRGPRDAIRWR